MAGINQGYTDVVIRGNNRSRSFSLFYLQDNRVLAADCINRPKDFMLTKKLILQGKAVDRQTLADETIELRTLIQGS